MARSSSNVKLFSTFVVVGISNVISKYSYIRGYATASQGMVSNGVKEASQATSAKRTAVLKRTGEEMAEAIKDNVCWVPDPDTGFYKPENRVNEICPAELRAMFLKKN